MLILGNKVESKYHILDTEDMVIDAISYPELLKAVQSGIVIDNLDSDLVPHINNLRARRSSFSYDCMIDGEKFCYGLVRTKFENRPIYIDSKDAVGVLYTTNESSSLNCVICIENSIYEIRNNNYRVSVNGKTVNAPPQYILEYAGWYRGYFILCFEVGVILLDSKSCYYARTVSHKSTLVKVVNGKYGDPIAVKRKVLLGK